LIGRAPTIVGRAYALLGPVVDHHCSEIGQPFFEDMIFCRLLIAIPLKMYSKIGQLKWILVGQILKLIGKWPMANCYSSTANR